MARRKPLRRREVRWRRRGDEGRSENVARYVRPGHHEDRGRAATRNDQVADGLEDYRQACEDGVAVIVDVTEVDDGEA